MMQNKLSMIVIANTILNLDELIMKVWLRSMSIIKEFQLKHQNALSRRHFLKQSSLGLGAIALGGLSSCSNFGTSSVDNNYFSISLSVGLYPEG